MENPKILATPSTKRVVFLEGWLEPLSLSRITVSQAAQIPVNNHGSCVEFTNSRGGNIEGVATVYSQVPSPREGARCKDTDREDEKHPEECTGQWTVVADSNLSEVLAETAEALWSEYEGRNEEIFEHCTICVKPDCLIFTLQSA
eukprot:4404736-Amphidinium_carterae.1